MPNHITAGPLPLKNPQPQKPVPDGCTRPGGTRHDFKRQTRTTEEVKHPPKQH